MLWTDGTPGLEILKGGSDSKKEEQQEQQWLPVPSVPNAFICNVGDLIERWTNGVMKSTVHRVVSRGANERHSCAFFWEPDFDTLVTPLPKCVAENPPQRFEPTTYGAYILAKYGATYAGFGEKK